MEALNVSSEREKWMKVRMGVVVVRKRDKTLTPHFHPIPTCTKMSNVRDSKNKSQLIFKIVA